jgi:hypothetical protein
MKIELYSVYYNVEEKDIIIPLEFVRTDQNSDRCMVNGIKIDKYLESVKIGGYIFSEMKMKAEKILKITPKYVEMLCGYRKLFNMIFKAKE